MAGIAPMSAKLADHHSFSAPFQFCGQTVFYKLTGNGKEIFLQIPGKIGINRPLMVIFPPVAAAGLYDKLAKM